MQRVALCAEENEGYFIFYKGKYNKYVIILYIMLMWY